MQWMTRQEEDMLQFPPSCPEDDGKGLEGEQQGEPSSQIRLCSRKGAQEGGLCPSLGGNTVSGCSRVNQRNPPSLCLQHQGSQIRQRRHRNSASQGNCSSHRPGCQVVRQQASQGHRHRRRPAGQEGALWEAARKHPGAVSWTAGTYPGSGQTRRDRTMSYTTQLQAQFMASRDEGFAWKHEDSTPRIPTPRSCRMSQRLPTSAHTPQRHLGGRRWERQSEN